MKGFFFSFKKKKALLKVFEVYFPYTDGFYSQFSIL